MSEVKVRRSDRIREKRIIKTEAALTVEERVIHDKYLWMEIARWEISVFRALTKITASLSRKRGDRHETLRHRRQIFCLFLKVEPLVCFEKGYGACGSKCAYIVTHNDRYFNPCGPHYFHFCSLEQYIIFDRGLYFFRSVNGKWYPGTLLKATITLEEAEWLDNAVTVYSTNPFADLRMPASLITN